VTDLDLEEIHIDVILTEDHHDCIKINYEDEYGYVAVPIYLDLSHLVDDLSKGGIPEVEPCHDKRNKSFDWLTHFVPALPFYTDDQVRANGYLNANDLFVDDPALPVHEFSVYTVLAEEDSRIYMGLYRMSIDMTLSDGYSLPYELEKNMTVSMLNSILCSVLENTGISHYELTRQEIKESPEDILTIEELNVKISEILNKQYDEAFGPDYGEDDDEDPVLNTNGN
jgi:hypothetical protein